MTVKAYTGSDRNHQTINHLVEAVQKKYGANFLITDHNQDVGNQYQILIWFSLAFNPCSHSHRLHIH